jgi:hypothetical protein
MGGCTRAGGAHRHCKPQVAFSMFVVAEALPDRPHRCALQDSSAEGSGPVARRASCAAASTMKMIIVPEPTWRRGFSAEQMKIFRLLESPARIFVLLRAQTPNRESPMCCYRLCVFSSILSLQAKKGCSFQFTRSAGGYTVKTRATHRPFNHINVHRI